MHLALHQRPHTATRAQYTAQQQHMQLLGTHVTPCSPSYNRTGSTRATRQSSLPFARTARALLLSFPRSHSKQHVYVWMATSSGLGDGAARVALPWSCVRRRARRGGCAARRGRGREPPWASRPCPRAAAAVPRRRRSRTGAWGSSRSSASGSTSRAAASPCWRAKS